MSDYLGAAQACILWEDVRGFAVVENARVFAVVAMAPHAVTLSLYKATREGDEAAAQNHDEFVAEWKRRRALKTAKPLEAVPEGWHFGDRVAHGPERQIIRVTRDGDIVAIPVDTAAAVIPPAVIDRLRAQSQPSES